MFPMLSDTNLIFYIGIYTVVVALLVFRKTDTMPLSCDSNLIKDDRQHNCFDDRVHTLSVEASSRYKK